MSEERLHAERTIPAPADAVFAVLADPGRHAAIDGTGWVERSLQEEQLREPGQLFRVRMFHPEHPDGNYDIVNEVLDLDAPHVISWRPGYVGSDGELEFGGWVWRYDLEQLGPDRTRVVLSYDWSAVGPGPRGYLDFPPFPQDHLPRSLEHLAGLVADAAG
ncbi:SRPBCC family protein [Serinicoccus kebangsaanensis]|uniref:SRPBCC family protein n=1 Tax=Serinicoccus kebangsaanensis TaxID=2602069 RepID=UPI00124C5B66|nr:SRPBCC family protein [Serinicoccus kebangsaanensis]